MNARPPSFTFPHRLGFGCSGAWAQPWFSESKARAVLLAAFEAGLRHVDTAGFYARGEAERRLGRVLVEFREPVFVSTKTGTRYHRFGKPSKDFSEAAIRRDVEASLRRLGRERLDLLYLHGPGEPALEAALDVLRRLKEEGKIALAGVCGEGGELSRSIDLGADVVMGAYNLFHRGHRPVFARAKEMGLGVVAIAPLAQGLYRRDLFFPRSPSDFWHLARALIRNLDQLRCARKACDILHSVDGWTPAQLALAFVHANPAIDVAVTTTTKRFHLDEAASTASRRLPSEVLRRLECLAS